MDEEAVREDVVRKLNVEFHALASGHDLYVAAYRTGNDFTNLAICIMPDKAELPEIIRTLELKVRNICDASDAKIEKVSEITTKAFTSDCKEADDRGYLKRSMWRADKRLHLNYFDNNFFKLNEEIATDGSLTKKQVASKAEAITADQSLLEEIERIYAPENS